MAPSPDADHRRSNSSSRCHSTAPHNSSTLITFDMSTEPEGAAEGQLQAPSPPQEAVDGAQKPPVKRSWRRKYRKMRAKFEDTMQTSNTLIKDEYRAVALARRLQEQNDQILEVLLDMNENARLPANRRFDLRSLAEIDAAVPSLDADADADADRERRIQDLRVDMVNGIITQEEYSRKVTQIRSTHSIAIARQLASLDERVPHSTDVPDPPPEGLILGEHAPGYMSPSHEEEYLAATDAALGDPTLYDPNAHDGRPLRITTSHPPPTEKDLTIRNPDSVYNWLRKNQPQVFLQDKEHHENLSEKSTARPANPSSRGGKRASAVSGNTPGPKGDHDDEETGFIPESGTGTGKGRRGNKEDDSAYRPKGGSSRPGKRKREDGDPVGKGGRKKNRASGGTSAG